MKLRFDAEPGTTTGLSPDGGLDSKLTQVCCPNTLIDTEKNINVTRCLFVSDLHGRPEHYEKLWRSIIELAPDAVFIGGDLLPPGGLGSIGSGLQQGDFVSGFLAAGFDRVRAELEDRYPAVFLIMGNDDSRQEEAVFLKLAESGLWIYAHARCRQFGSYQVCGYSFVPPTPFLNKDWERYDVSRYVPPGGVSPEQGHRSVPRPVNRVRFATIRKDLEELAGERPLDNAVFLFHSPPSDTCLDRVANDGRLIDAVPLDLHVGSVAIRRFIEQRQPLLTLHGHIHESARLTGSWKDRIGRTHLFGAAHDGPELSLVRFDLSNLDEATRVLL